MNAKKSLPKATLAKKAKEIKSFKKGFDFVSDHVVITDAHGNIVYANKAVEKNTGFSIAEILGKNPGDLWGGTMPQDFYERMWHTIKEKKKPFVDEVQNKKKDGTEYWQELHISPILDSFNEVKFFIGIEPNITDKKEKEKFRKSFIADIGQQAQQPLIATNWILQWLLLNSTLTEEQEHSLDQIDQHQRNLVDLLDNLVHLSDAEKNIK